MLVERIRRVGLRNAVHFVMDQREFLEIVEWLETIDPRDAATENLRRDYDRLFPAESDG